MFELDYRLAEDTVVVGDFALCRLLLSRDANYPWYILVPRREEVREIYHLDEGDRQQLLRESCLLSEAVTDVHSPDKLNVAALGNVVAQLHIHHVARYTNDVAWPGPIWGVAPPLQYSEQELLERVQHMRQVLGGDDFSW